MTKKMYLDAEMTAWKQSHSHSQISLDGHCKLSCVCLSTAFTKTWTPSLLLCSSTIHWTSPILSVLSHSTALPWILFFLIWATSNQEGGYKCQGTSLSYPYSCANIRTKTQADTYLDVCMHPTENTVLLTLTWVSFWKLHQRIQILCHFPSAHVTTVEVTLFLLLSPYALIPDSWGEGVLSRKSGKRHSLLWRETWRSFPGQYSEWRLTRTWLPHLPWQHENYTLGHLCHRTMGCLPIAIGKISPSLEKQVKLCRIAKGAQVSSYQVYQERWWCHRAEVVTSPKPGHQTSGRIPEDETWQYQLRQRLLTWVRIGLYA